MMIHTNNANNSKKFFPVIIITFQVSYFDMFGSFPFQMVPIESLSQQ